MKIIVAVDEKWGIGLRGQLLFHIENDLKQFKEITMNGTVFMGRKTFESLPGKKPLVGRKNIVLTRNRLFDGKGAIVVHSYSELDQMIWQQENVFCIGGGELYSYYISQATDIFLTKVRITCEADTYFPIMNESDTWELVSESAYQMEGGLEYCFLHYRRKYMEKELEKL